MNKHKAAILVDSGTDVPQEIMEQEHIFMIPLKIIYKDREYIDKLDITAEEIYQRMPEEIPSTSLPDGETIQSIFDEIRDQGFERVLAITISSGLSGTNNAVRLMAEHNPDLETVIIDTKNIGIGAGLFAIYAAEMLRGEFTWEEIIDEMKKQVKRNKVFFNVATLEYLQKGGRIGLVSSLVGNALKLMPIISCNEEGIYYTVAKTRGRKKSLEKALEIVKAHVGSHPRFRLAVAQGDALEEAKMMFERLKELLPSAEKIYFGEISPSLVVHTGPGLIGIGVQILD